MNQYRSLTKRYESLLRRINTLSSLRTLINFTETEDISKRQWSSIESSLFEAQAQLSSRLKNAGRKYLPFLHNNEDAAKFNFIMGKIDLDLSNYIIFFDTYLDILSQRKISSLGRILAGCDVIAWDALNKDNPVLSAAEHPVLSFQRGLGALIIRVNVTFPGGIRNPLPLIQIPYSRLASKHDLTSIVHEIGHEVTARLGLVHLLPKVFRKVLSTAGASENLVDLFELWTSEIGPDFWTFCNCGAAQTSSIKEMLSLPQSYVFHFSIMDPHPPPSHRVLLSIEWCRQQWGRGDWDIWEEEWRRFYPIEHARSETKATLEEAKIYLPEISKALFQTRFKVLNGRRLIDLFDMSALNPSRLERIVRSKDFEAQILRLNSPCVQLAAFRLLRDKRMFSEEFIDKLMTRWLIYLGENKSGKTSEITSRNKNKTNKSSIYE